MSKVTISHSNSKLGDMIPSVSLAPECSCRKDAPCAKGCYAKKGNFTFSNVHDSHVANYNAYMENHREYFQQIIKAVGGKMLAYRFFRWHVAGDIVDTDYLEGMCMVARACKTTKFLCFTKKFDLVNDYVATGKKIPNNLHIVFSAWHKAFKVPNPYNFPMAYVFFKKSDMNPDIPSLAIPCQGHCESCLACWSLKKGQSVVFNQH